MIVYPMRPEDAAETAALERACFPDPWSLAGVRGSLDSPCGFCLAAREEGGLAAYLIARVVAEEGELLRIATAESFRRRGIGEQLLSRMLADNPGVKLWRLDVRCGNAAALRLYERAGFRAAVRNKNFYREPQEDGFLMVREL